MSMELGATFRVKNDHTYDAEIDLDFCETRDEAYGNAITEIFDNGYSHSLVDDDIELVEIICRSSDNNITEWISDINWSDLFINKFDCIHDLCQLKDDEDRSVALYLYRDGGYADLGDACNVARQQSYSMYQKKEDLIDIFIKVENISASSVEYLDHDKILDSFWEDRIDMPDGKVLIMSD